EAPTLFGNGGWDPGAAVADKNQHEQSTYGATWRGVLIARSRASVRSAEPGSARGSARTDRLSVLPTRKKLRREAPTLFGTAAGVVAMFLVSGVYHVVTWGPRVRSWLARLDHATVYGLIAATYTPFGVLALHGAWRVTVLAIVWSGALAAMLLKLFWVRAPKW